MGLVETNVEAITSAAGMDATMDALVVVVVVMMEVVVFCALAAAVMLRLPQL